MTQVSVQTLKRSLVWPLEQLHTKLESTMIAAPFIIVPQSRRASATVFAHTYRLGAKITDVEGVSWIVAVVNGRYEFTTRHFEHQAKASG